MALSRRSLFAAGGGLLGGSFLASCAPLAQRLATVGPPAPWPSPAEPAWPTLRRLTFGPTAEERAYAAAIGSAGWIEEQLAPAALDDWAASLRVLPFDTLAMDEALIFDVRQPVVQRELQQATLLRAIYSRRQLYELMVEFWSDHFSISIDKGECAWLKPIDDRTVVRQHAMGNFSELLWASMRSPAMLVYLDNQENGVGAPNENYARELLELHTLGVDGGYSQADVQAVARCLTGWWVDGGLLRGQPRFEPAAHDRAAKQLFGATLSDGDERDIERLHSLVLSHPATPRFIARKLARRLVAEEPPAALVEQASLAFKQSNWSITALLRSLLFSAEFSAPSPRFKRPLHLVAGALRQLSAESDGGAPLLEALAAMGQPLFRWPTPDGFPDRDAVWQAGLLPRWQFALGLASGTLKGTTIDLPGLMGQAGPAPLDRLATLLLGGPLPAPQATVLSELLASAGEAMALAALLAAPAYQWR